MSTDFDMHAINHVTVALNREMTPQGHERHADDDTLFMGVPALTTRDQDALARFALSKNYRMIFASFDPAFAWSGPTNYHAVVTDGVSQSTVLSDGLLWKRYRGSAAVLIFPSVRLLVKLSAKGRLTVGVIKGRHHDHAYELAKASLSARTRGTPGHAPVVSPIGKLVTVLDRRTLAATFAAG